MLILLGLLVALAICGALVGDRDTPSGSATTRAVTTTRAAVTTTQRVTTTQVVTSDMLFNLVVEHTWQAPVSP